MPSVETTTIRVRRSTHKRLQEEARRQGKSVTEVMEAAVDMLEEQRLLQSFVRCYELHGDEIRAEMKDWLDMPGPPLPDDGLVDLPAEENDGAQSPERGDIYVVEPGPTIGSEQRGRRPYLVASIDPINAAPAELTIVMPITTTEWPNALHVRIDPAESGAKF